MCPVRPLSSRKDAAVPSLSEQWDEEDAEEAEQVADKADAARTEYVADEAEPIKSRDLEEGMIRLDEGEAEDEDMVVQKPMGLKSPDAPTRAEMELHWLTHLPYRSWCKWCVMAKRANSPHFQLPTHSRSVPLLVVDYCFVRDSQDQDLLTCLVGRLYPSRAVITVPCV